ncbi:hypothetical protein ACE41H_15715 [Paenibacillus enshidis]|uniref:DNA polymerase III subunit beta n=1 Tax=Paenibacillus enshidis TaxID=1458439 RepID=A0ABV5AVH4_9BACL
MSVVLEQLNSQQEEETSQVIDFSVEQNSLSQAFQLCARVIPKNSHVPLLQCIKLDIIQDKLFITAMDIEQGVLQVLDIVNQGDNGSFLLPAKEGMELIRRLPSGTMKFTKDGMELEIHHSKKKSTAKLRVLAADEYPLLPDINTGITYKLSLKHLSQGAEAAEFAGTNANVPVLTGIQLYNDEGRIAFLSTDRYRVYRYITDVEWGSHEPKTYLVPALLFQRFVDVIPKSNDAIELVLTDRRMFLRAENLMYFVSLLDGTPPNVARAFTQKKIGHQVTMSREELYQTLHLALSMDCSDNRITLQRNDMGLFSIFGKSDYVEINEVFEDVLLDDDFPEVIFNGLFTKKAIAVTESEQVTITVKGPLDPAFVTFPEVPSIELIILPIRPISL